MSLFIYSPGRRSSRGVKYSKKSRTPSFEKKKNNNYEKKSRKKSKNH